MHSLFEKPSKSYKSYALVAIHVARYPAGLELDECALDCADELIFASFGRRPGTLTLGGGIEIDPELSDSNGQKFMISQEQFGFDFNVLSEGGIEQPLLVYEYEQVGCDIFEPFLEKFVVETRRLLSKRSERSAQIEHVFFIALFDSVMVGSFEEFEVEHELCGFVTAKEIYEGVFKKSDG